MDGTMSSSSDILHVHNSNHMHICTDKHSHSDTETQWNCIYGGRTMKAQHHMAMTSANLRRNRALLRTSARPLCAATVALASANGASGRCALFLEAMAAKAAVASPCLHERAVTTRPHHVTSVSSISCHRGVQSSVDTRLISRHPPHSPTTRVRSSWCIS